MFSGNRGWSHSNCYPFYFWVHFWEILLAALGTSDHPVPNPFCQYHSCPLAATPHRSHFWSKPFEPGFYQNYAAYEIFLQSLRFSKFGSSGLILMNSMKFLGDPLDRFSKDNLRYHPRPDPEFSFLFWGIYSWAYAICWHLLC
jgi:hypothetical protein